jgi:hypothetical protein
MSNPFPNMNVEFETDPYNINLTEIENRVTKKYGRVRSVSNYEYETERNEKKRQILILKPEYLSAFISDMKNIMKYGKSSQYIDDKTKRVYNPRTTNL